MDQLPEVLGKEWNELVRESNPPVKGFEAQFSWIRRQTAHSSGLIRIEKLIFEYFENLELPDTPTIYDYIVLGLRSKDIVATFNWDPLLLLAHKRNRTIKSLPDIRFLHGCAGLATCQVHDVLGSPFESCPLCNKALIRGKLFFPDDDKDYTKDELISREWGVVAENLKNAFHLTIFGYSGPVTDYNARRLLLEGWTQSPLLEMSHVEIIDIRDEDELRRCWKEFIPFHHDMITTDFARSTIARWPRRTAEYKMMASFYGIPAEDLGHFETNSLQELQDWHSEIAATEDD